MNIVPVICIFKLITVCLFVSSCINHSSNPEATSGKTNYSYSYFYHFKKAESLISDIPDYHYRPLPDSILAKYNNGKIFPVDEKFKDSSLELFLDSLDSAVQEKNAMFILNHLSDSIRNGYGSGIPDGTFGFKDTWGYKDNQLSEEFWVLMKRALSLGGKFTIHQYYNKKLYQIPYLEFPSEISDMFMSQAAIATNVPVYEKPDITSKIVGFLNYDIVDVNFQESGIKPLFEGTTGVCFEQLEWIKIQTLNQEIAGFVDGKYMYANLGFRLYLEKIDEKWCIRELMIGE